MVTVPIVSKTISGKTKGRIVMESSGKRTWKKKLEEDSASSTMNRNVQALLMGVCIIRSTSKKKARAQVQPTATMHITP